MTADCAAADFVSVSPNVVLLCVQDNAMNIVEVEVTGAEPWFSSVPKFDRRSFRSFGLDLGEHKLVCVGTTAVFILSRLGACARSPEGRF